MPQQVLHCIAVCSLLMLTACFVEEATEVESSVANQVEVSSRVWVLDGWNHCGDVYGRPCTSSFPAPQCTESNPAGQPCSTWGWCYKTVTSGWFMAFECR